jgi:hypothetical protein
MTHDAVPAATDPTPAERAAAARAAGWEPLARGSYAGVIRTIALARSPGRGRARTAAAVWTAPAAASVVLLDRRRRYHCEDGTVTTTLHRPRRLRARDWATIVACGMALSVGTGVLQDAGLLPRPVLVAAVLPLYAYVISVGVLWAARGRRDRTPAERAGPLREKAVTGPGWEIGRVLVRHGDPTAAVPAARDLVDAVVPAGEEVRVLARSATEQAAWEAAGFTPVPRALGVLVRRVPEVSAAP